MEFLEVVGSRRSIRWFRPWQPVEVEKVQRILEAARVTGCPGNLQPWRAVVVSQIDLDPVDRDRLLDAANRQRPHEQAPVWRHDVHVEMSAREQAFRRFRERAPARGIKHAEFTAGPQLRAAERLVGGNEASRRPSSFHESEHLDPRACAGDIPQHAGPSRGAKHSNGVLRAIGATQI